MNSYRLPALPASSRTIWRSRDSGASRLLPLRWSPSTARNCRFAGMTAPRASIGICGTGSGFTPHKFWNGEMPRKCALRIVFSMELILLNGTAMIVFMPRMMALTTVWKVFSMPSLMPDQIRPPVENTSLTFCHASRNLL